MARTQAQPLDNSSHTASVDEAEIARFSALADEWWDESGPFKPLHRMNPVRIAYIRDQIAQHLSTTTTPTLLDIGCGGGLISEPMARLGAHVTGIDASEKNIGTASVHAKQSGLTIDYRATTAEALASTGAQYDCVLALEIIEHVADINAFLDALYTLVKPGGLLILSTLNRTAKSYAFAIVGAEYILRLLPRGTHQWRKFIRPSELAKPLRARGLTIADTMGMVMGPFSGAWSLDAHDLDVNYLITSTKPL